MVLSAAPGLPVRVLGGSSLLPTGVLKWEGGKRGVEAEEMSIKSVIPAPKKTDRRNCPQKVHLQAYKNEDSVKSLHFVPE